MNCERHDEQERWLGPWPFGAFLALALFACFSHVLLGFESFFYRDYGVFSYPMISYQRECFWRGELPLWNPYSNCGHPFLAQWGTMALYPGALIYLLFPLPLSLSLFCFFHLWLAGMGMYVLARHWTTNNLAAAIAGAAYVFNGIMFASFVWPHYLVALAWMPFVVLLGERAWREGGRCLVGAAVVAGLQMLSGAPELIVLTWIVLGALLVCDICRTRGLTVIFLRRIIFVVLLTAGLAAAQLLPFFELLKLSHRDATFATDKWQLPLWGWANFLVPLYNTFETPFGQYWQYEQSFLASVYLGGAVVAFALVALIRWPDPRIRVLAALAVVSVIFAFGNQTPVYTAARNAFPFMGIARYSSKFLFTLCFVVPLLAGCGAAAVIRRKRTGTLIFTTALVLAAMVAIAWAGYGQRFVDYSSWPNDVRGNMEYSWRRAAPGHFVSDGIANTLWRFLCALLVPIAFSKALPRDKWTPLFAYLVLMVLAFDTSTHLPRQHPTLPVRFFTESFWSAEPKPEAGKARVMITPETEQFILKPSGTNEQRVWEFTRRAEWSNLHLLDHVPKVNGSSVLQIREQRIVEQTLYSMTNNPPGGLLDFLGVGWITSASGSNWSPRLTAAPIITAGQQPLFANNSEALSILTNSTFDPRNTVLLPLAAQHLVLNSNSATVTISGVRFTSHSIDALVNAAAPTIVVLAQSFYPAWHATVDGLPTPLLRANVAFQAVPIAAGQHRLQLVYSDRMFRAGCAISAGTILICVLSLCFVRRSTQA